MTPKSNGAEPEVLIEINVAGAKFLNRDLFLGALQERMGVHPDDGGIAMIQCMATALGVPVGLFAFPGKDTARTAIAGPASWPEGKLEAWLDEHRPQLEAVFGKTKCRRSG